MQSTASLRKPFPKRTRRRFLKKSCGRRKHDLMSLPCLLLSFVFAVLSHIEHLHLNNTIPLTIVKRGIWVFSVGLHPIPLADGASMGSRKKIPWTSRVFPRLSMDIQVQSAYKHREASPCKRRFHGFPIVHWRPPQGSFLLRAALPWVPDSAPTAGTGKLPSASSVSGVLP